MKDDSDDNEEREAGNGGGLETVKDSNVFFYIMLTLVFLLTVLALVMSILAYVKATSQNPGPAGPQGPGGTLPTSAMFEQPAFYVSTSVYVMSPDPTLQPRFLVFNAQPTAPFIINAQLPPAAPFNGAILRLYNVEATGGVLLSPFNGDAPVVPSAFNPIPPGFFAMAISDGVSQWAINSSTFLVA